MFSHSVPDPCLSACLRKEKALNLCLMLADSTEVTVGCQLIYSDTFLTAACYSQAGQPLQWAALSGFGSEAARPVVWVLCSRLLWVQPSTWWDLNSAGLSVRAQHCQVWGSLVSRIPLCSTGSFLLVSHISFPDGLSSAGNFSFSRAFTGSLSSARPPIFTNSTSLYRVWLYSQETQAEPTSNTVQFP